MRKILLVPDIPNWAWDHNADGIIKNLPQYKFTKMYGRILKDDVINKFDSVLIFPWYDVIDKYMPKVHTAVSAHNFQYYWADRAKKSLPRFKSIAAFSNKIKIILEQNNLNKNIYHCPCGIDEKLFYPKKKPRNKKFIIGWVGKMLQENKKGFNMKGYNILLNPIIEKLKNHHDIEFLINNRGHRNSYKFTDMPNYYNKIDLQICTSFREGTPNPMFEASACGKPIISTDVGCMPDLVKHGENGFIIPTFNNEVEARRRVNDFVKYILYLKDNRDFAEEMGNKNRQVIEKDWTWKTKAKNYIPIFEGN